MPPRSGRPRKVTPAAIRVVEVRGTGPALLGNLRQVDALLVVLDGFSGTRVPENASRTTSSASTWRRLPSMAGPVPRTSTTRIAAGVTLRDPMTLATRDSRSSGIPAMPTSPVARIPVSAWNNVDLPDAGKPTIPTSSATTAV